MTMVSESPVRANLESTVISQNLGEFHTHHINDVTDGLPNDYMPMVIPVNGKIVEIAPVITCTALENDVFVPYHYPCKLAQTLFVDDNWSDRDANYTYLFEDWTDYDFNDIVVNLYAVTNDVIDVEIHLESRHAVWKNPFGIQITPVNMVVGMQVYWNSTDYPEEHTLKLNPGETVDIELFGESNPYDTAFITIFEEAPAPPPVGGHATPIDKLHFVAPKIGSIPGTTLAFVLLVVLAATIILIRHRNKTLRCGY